MKQLDIVWKKDSSYLQRRDSWGSGIRDVFCMKNEASRQTGRSYGKRTWLINKSHLVSYISVNKQVPHIEDGLCLPKGLSCPHSWVPWCPHWATLALLVPMELLERNRACLPLPLPASNLPHCSAQVTHASQVRDASRYRRPPVFRHSSQVSFDHHTPSSRHLDFSEILASNRTLILCSVQPPPRSHVHGGSWPHLALRQTSISPSQT